MRAPEQLVVRRKDHRQQAPGPKHTPALVNRLAGRNNVLENVVHRDEVERAVSIRESFASAEGERHVSSADVAREFRRMGQHLVFLDLHTGHGTGAVALKPDRAAPEPTSEIQNVPAAEQPCAPNPNQR